MSAIIENLNRLNRKERFFLIGMALGNPEFRLGQVFRNQLNDGFRLVIPDNAFVAMDYHLNWIYAAASLSYGNPVLGRLFDNHEGDIDGTQEDVDLLVAYEENNGVNHLIMLEAKGVDSFNNRQFEHKMKRLKSLFGQECEKWPNIKPHLGLVSPRESQGLHYDACPLWLKTDGKIPWFKMPIPKDRLTMFGCNERGRPNQVRAFWTVRQG
jgi:hypothetical protein